MITATQPSLWCLEGSLVTHGKRRGPLPSSVPRKRPCPGVTSQQRHFIVTPEQAVKACERLSWSPFSTASLPVFHPPASQALTAISSQQNESSTSEMEHVSEDHGSAATFGDLPPEVLWYYLLPYLSGKDVVRLTGVSRRFHEFFGAEETFKMLCKRDFAVSGSRSFRTAYKLLHVGSEITQLDLSVVHVLEELFQNELPPVCDHRIYRRLRDQVLCHLSIASSSIARATASGNVWRFLAPASTMASFVTIRRCKQLFPSLPPGVIKEKHGDALKLTPTSHPRYSLSRVAEIAAEHFGSVEAVQEKQMEILQQHESELLDLMPYCSRSRKLKELASRLCNPTPKTTAELRSFAYSDPIRAVDHEQPEGWEWAGRDTEHSLQWAKKCCVTHPILRCYLRNQLRMDVADYLQACVEFEALFAEHAVARFSRTAVLSVYQHLSLSHVYQRTESLSKDTLLGIMLGCACCLYPLPA